MDWGAGGGGGGVEILLVTSCDENWDKLRPDGHNWLVCRLNLSGIEQQFYLALNNNSIWLSLVMSQSSRQKGFDCILHCSSRTHTFL